MILNGGGIQSDGGSSGSEGGVRGGQEGGLKKGPWTAAEDSILMEYVRKHGEGNWNSVQRNSGLNRCGKSCRLRWANHLRPNLKKGAFSAEEERLILELHAKFGNKWARMAAQLPGRTDNEIKNYWNTRVKRRQRQGLPLYPHDILPLSAPTTPSSSASASVSGPTTPTTPTTVPLFHFPPQIHPLSPLSSPNPLPFSPSSSSSAQSFTFHRPPPILGLPLRFKTFNRSNGGFSLPQNPTPILIQSPPPQHPSSFQFSPHLTSNSMENLRTQFETQKMAMSSINFLNSELPSNQIIMESKVGPPVNHSGLLDDLLAEAQALACEDTSNTTHCLVSHDERTFFHGFNKIDDSDPANFFFGETQKEEPRDGANLGHDDWSKLLNGIPPSGQSGEWYGNRGEIPNSHSSNLVGENGGLDMQDLASFFPVASESEIGRTPTSWGTTCMEFERH